MSNRIQLKPCPFCGGEAYLAETLDKIYISCNHTEDCGIRPDGWLNSSKDLVEQIKNWNKRYEDNSNFSWWAKKIKEKEVRK